MKNVQKRTLAIHDISGFGRCSLTVILPVFSAMGTQVCPVPTAVLSTHTGGLGEVVLRDLTDFIKPCLQHYQSLQLGFDAIYTGFLSGEAQIDSCLSVFEAYKDSLIVVDPVMGDHGKPYRTCTPTLQKRMTELVRRANLITPNLTETCILLGIPQITTPLTHTEAKGLLLKLSGLGPDNVIITGVQLSENVGRMANLGYVKEQNAFWYTDCDYLPVSYPGTGDIFSSVVVGGLLTGDSLPAAMARATEFVEIAMKTTYSYGTDTRYGVMLETALPFLIDKKPVKDYRIL